jgi:hypothetical protein
MPPFLFVRHLLAPGRDVMQPGASRALLVRCALSPRSFRTMELPFNEAGVSVTRTALSVAGQVFALRDIEDVQVIDGRRNRALPITLSVLGVALAVFGGVSGSAAALACGVMLFVVGLIAWFTQDAPHRLIVVIGGEQREALTSMDRGFAERVEQVVRLAMAGRGETANPANPSNAAGTPR